jgi:hypothetical protein
MNPRNSTKSTNRSVLEERRRAMARVWTRKKVKTKMTIMRKKVTPGCLPLSAGMVSKSLRKHFLHRCRTWWIESYLVKYYWERQS